MSQLIAPETGSRGTVATPLMEMAQSRQDEQERRICIALGLAQGPLPEVQRRWLERYYRYLAANLSFPFDAEYVEDVLYNQIASAIAVIGLIDPEEHTKHEELGLLCRARKDSREIDVPLVDVEVNEESPNYRLAEDYWYWFWNWRFDPQI